ncbi:MAG: magnesium transporter [Phycisphaeraceae bacterium]|nr:magnesium transporter [Phycisphaeraceae bacterium]
MSHEASITIEWQQLAEVIDSGNAEYLCNFLHLLPPEDTAYTIARLDEDHQTRMLEMLTHADPELAADLLEHFADGHAADMLEELKPETAAAIVDAMDSDEQTDVLAELHEDDAAAILDKMAPEEAADARKRLAYDEDTAGGLMITEVLVFPKDCTVESAVSDLRHKAESNQDFESRYIYVVGDAGRFIGVVPMRRLVLSPRDKPLTQLMVGDPLTVHVNTPLNDLDDLFDRVPFSALPVLDDAASLVGVVQRAKVEEALGERSDEQLAKFGGIIGGEELRNMPLLSRTLRRLAFLLPNVVLSAISVTIILFYEPIIHKMTLLAVVLPLVANLSGAAGNQSVAVTIRELALGLVRPGDFIRIWSRDLGIGVINGLVVGLMLGVVSMILCWASMQMGLVESRYQQDLLPLAGIVACSYFFNSILAVLIGGTVPLALKGLHVDPAMASSPILTTVTDMCSFMVTLTLALILIHLMGGV